MERKQTGRNRRMKWKVERVRERVIEFRDRDIQEREG